MSKPPEGTARQDFFDTNPGDPYWVGQAIKVAVEEFAHRAKNGENFRFGQKRMRDEWTKTPDMRGRNLIVSVDLDGTVHVRELHDTELDGG